MTDHHSHERPAPGFWRTRHAAGCLVLAAVAAWFLWAEHRAHLLGALPYLLLLACPLVHVFMHRGHTAHHGPGPAGSAGPDAGRPPVGQGGST